MSINRSRQPGIVSFGKPEFPNAVTSQLSNGIPVYLLRAGSREVSRIEFSFQAGSWYQHKALQAGLTNAMLVQGSKGYSAAAIAEWFDFHGAYLQPSADQHLGQINAVALSRHWRELLPVMADVLQNPVFPEEAFQMVLNQKRKSFLVENQKIRVQCLKKFSQVLFGPQHPYAQNVTMEDYERITRDDLLDFARDNYLRGVPELFVSGCFDDDLLTMLETYFGGIVLFEKKKQHSNLPEIRESAEHFVRVSHPGSMQSAIRIGRRLVGKSHSDYFPLQILITVLGGYFSSRLMQNIREEKGYTYGIGAGFYDLLHEGYMVISTEVNGEYERATIDEIFKEIALLREKPIGDAELSRVKKYLKGEFLRDFDGPFALEQAFREVHDFGIDSGHYDSYWESLEQVDSDSLMKMARKYLNEDDLFVVVAGGNQ